MNQFIKQLPRVLQNEIWEYVRGGRAYWKQQFTQTILKVIIHVNQNLRNAVKRCSELGEGRCMYWRLGNRFVNLHSLPYNDEWEVYVQEEGSSFGTIFESDDLEFKEAVKLFYEKVEIEAIRGPTTKLIRQISGIMLTTN